MNNPANPLFLELIRSAIWNRKADENLFNDVNESVWKEIIVFAESQSVRALIYDGILTLPKSVWPDKKTVYKLFLQTEIIEKRNQKFIDELKSISAEYSKINCQFILLKGQGNGSLYPNPSHRSPGDIDLYLYRKDDYLKANRWAVSNGFKLEDENIHHQGFEYHDIHIENHKNICFFGIKKYDRLIDEKIKDIIQKNMFEKIDLDGLRVKILPVELNAFYIFYHLFHHFIHLGIGMRQLCDWTLFMKTYSADINSKSFNELVDSFDLTYAMKSFASFTVKYLGAKPEYFPFETDINNKYVDIILEDVFSGGNFGYDLFKKRTFHSELHRKWYSFRFSTKRIVKIADLAPEHIKPLPFIKLNTNLRLLVNTIKNNIRSV